MIARGERRRLELLYAVGGRAFDVARRARDRKWRWFDGWRRRWYEENAYCGSCAHSKGVRAKTGDGEWPIVADLVRCTLNDCLCMFGGKPCEEWEWLWR